MKLSKKGLWLLIGSIGFVVIATVAIVVAMVAKPSVKPPKIVESAEIVGTAGLTAYVGDVVDVSGISVVFTENGENRVVAVSSSMVVLPSIGTDAKSGLNSNGIFVQAGNKIVTVVVEGWEFEFDILVYANYVSAISVNLSGGKVFAEESSALDAIVDLKVVAKFSATGVWKSIGLDQIEIARAVDEKGDSVLVWNGNEYVFKKTNVRVFSQNITLVLRYVGTVVPSLPSAGEIEVEILAKLADDNVKQVVVDLDTSNQSTVFYESVSNNRDLAKTIAGLDVKTVRESGAISDSCYFTDKSFLFEIVEIDGKFFYAFVMDTVSETPLTFVSNQKNSFWIVAFGNVFSPFGMNVSLVGDGIAVAPSQSIVVGFLSDGRAYFSPLNSNLVFFPEVASGFDSQQFDFSIVLNYSARSADKFFDISKTVGKTADETLASAETAFGQNFVVERNLFFVITNSGEKLVTSASAQNVVSTLGLIDAGIRYFHNFGFSDQVEVFLNEFDEFEFENGSIVELPNVSEIHAWRDGLNNVIVMQKQLYFLSNYSGTVVSGGFSGTVLGTSFVLDLIDISTSTQVLKTASIGTFGSNNAYKVRVIPDILVDFAITAKPTNYNFALYSLTAKNLIGSMNSKSNYFLGDTINVSTISALGTMASGDVVSFLENGTYVAFGQTRYGTTANPLFEIVPDETCKKFSGNIVTLSDSGNKNVIVKYVGEFASNSVTDSFSIQVFKDSILSIQKTSNDWFVTSALTGVSAFETLLANRIVSVSVLSRAVPVPVSQINFVSIDKNLSSNFVFGKLNLRFSNTVNGEQFDFNTLNKIQSLFDLCVFFDGEVSLQADSIQSGIETAGQFVQNFFVVEKANVNVTTNALNQHYYLGFKTGDNLFDYAGEKLNLGSLAINAGFVALGGDNLFSSSAVVKVLNNGVVILNGDANMLFSSFKDMGIWNGYVDVSGFQFVVLDSANPDAKTLGVFDVSIAWPRASSMSFDTSNLDHFFTGESKTRADFAGLVVKIMLDNGTEVSGVFDGSGMLHFNPDTNFIMVPSISGSFLVNFKYTLSGAAFGSSPLIASASIYAFTNAAVLKIVNVDSSNLTSERFLSNQGYGTIYPAYYMTGNGTLVGNEEYQSLKKYLYSMDSLRNNLANRLVVSGSGQGIFDYLILPCKTFNITYVAGKPVIVIGGITYFVETNFVENFDGVQYNRVVINGVQHLVDVASGKFAFFNFSIRLSNMPTFDYDELDVDNLAFEELAEAIFALADASGDAAYRNIIVSVNYNMISNGVLSVVSDSFVVTLVSIADVEVQNNFGDIFENQVISLGTVASGFEGLSEYSTSAVGFDLAGVLAKLVSARFVFNGVQFDAKFGSLDSDKTMFLPWIDNDEALDVGYVVSNDGQFVLIGNFLGEGSFVRFRLVFRGIECTVDVAVFEDFVESTEILSSPEIVSGSNVFSSGLFEIVSRLTYASGKKGEDVSFSNNGNCSVPGLSLWIVSGTKFMLANSFNFGFAFDTIVSGDFANRLFALNDREFALRVDFAGTGGTATGVEKPILIANDGIANFETDNIVSTYNFSIVKYGLFDYFSLDGLKFSLKSGLLVDVSNFDVKNANGIYFSSNLCLDTLTGLVSTNIVPSGNWVELVKIELVKKSAVSSADIVVDFENFKVNDVSTSENMFYFAFEKQNVKFTFTIQERYFSGIESNQTRKGLTTGKYVNYVKPTLVNLAKTGLISKEFDFGQTISIKNLEGVAFKAVFEGFDGETGLVASSTGINVPLADLVFVAGNASTLDYSVVSNGAGIVLTGAGGSGNVLVALKGFESQPVAVLLLTD